MPIVMAAALSTVAVAAVGVSGAFGTDRVPGPPAVSNDRPDATPVTAPVRVFNVEGDCKHLKERVLACSMGLARDPRLKYGTDNVVGHRIWHDDVLNADCILYDGDRVEDEMGVGTTRWFRVRLDDVPGGLAWLPAVRTHDNPPLPTCTH